LWASETDLRGVSECLWVLKLVRVLVALFVDRRGEQGKVKFQKYPILLFSYFCFAGFLYFHDVFTYVPRFKGSGCSRDTIPLSHLTILHLSTKVNTR
jgi:hypothetical protein